MNDKLSMSRFNATDSLLKDYVSLKQNLNKQRETFKPEKTTPNKEQFKVTSGARHSVDKFAEKERGSSRVSLQS